MGLLISISPAVGTLDGLLIAISPAVGAPIGADALHSRPIGTLGGPRDFDQSGGRGFGGATVELDSRIAEPDTASSLPAEAGQGGCMLYGMTGFGRGAAGSVVVEVKSLNHRSLDAHLSLPAWAGELEGMLLALLREHVGRGRVELRVHSSASLGGGVELDEAALRSVYAQLHGIAVDLGVESGLRLADALVAPGLWRTGASELPEGFADELRSATLAALSGLDGARAEEGRGLELELRGYLARLDEGLAAVRERAPQRQSEYAQRLRDRVRELGGEFAVDPQRLALEVALLADKVDIGEEMQRAEAHVAAMRATIEGKRGAAESVGKKLDFYCQELGRELNTLSAKSRDGELARLAVELRSALDSMREQVQNVQ